MHQQERLTPEDILLKEQLNEKAVVRQKSRQQGGNSDPASSLKINEAKTFVAGPRFDQAT